MTGDEPGDRLSSGSSRMNQAIELHRDGRLPEAERLYAEILAADPMHFEALHHLGILRLQAGDATKAVELIRAAIALNPHSAAACSDLATANNILRRHEDAVAGYEDALIIDPDRAEAHYGLGIALQAQARIDEAIACFQRALVIDPDYVEAQCALGLALQLAARHADAIVCYQQALAIAPDYAEAQFGLATALRAVKRLDEGIVHYRRALALKSDYAEAYHGLGLALHAQFRHEDALHCFEEALAIRADYAEAHASRGILLQVIGRIADARDAFERASDLEPERPSHYFALANCSPMQADDPKLAAMQQLALDRRSLTPVEQVQLHFALGKALSDTGDYDQSFEHLLRGNALKRQQVLYDEATSLALFERIRDVFTPELMGAKQGGGNPSTTPVFIVGMPRSGSTLVEQILASHPAVFGAGERDDFRSAIIRLGADNAETPFPESVRALTGAQLYALGTSYLDQIGQAAASGRAVGTGERRLEPERITDKTLMHFSLLGLIRLALPNARIIHTRRNPIDTCLSCYSKLFDDELPFTYDLGELGRYYCAYGRLMEYWRKLLPAGWVLDVEYEALIQDFEPQARRINAHCGIEWNDACLAFHETQRPIRTASATQVRQPLFRSSIKRWRPEEKLLLPLLIGLGTEKRSHGPQDQRNER